MGISTAVRERDRISDLAWVVQETVVEGPRRFRHRNRTVDVPAARGPDAGSGSGTGTSAGEPFDALEQALALHLYREAYCPGRGGAGAPPPVHPDQDEDLTPRFSRANRSRDRWDEGWVIGTMEPAGQLVAHRGPEQRRLFPGGWVVPGGSGRAVPGSRIRIPCVAEVTDLQPGFYFAMGGGLAGEDPGAELVRLYWNISVEGAPALLSGITGALERFSIPFRMKIANRPHLFHRSEPAVVYLHRRYVPGALECLAPVYEGVSSHLRHPVPLFTRRLARGLALAEDPLSRNSFGLDRCRHVARGLRKVWEAGIHDASGRQAHVSAFLGSLGLDPDRLYLNPGSRDVHELPSHWTEAA